MKKHIHIPMARIMKRTFSFVLKQVVLVMLVCSFLPISALAWDADHSNWKNGAVYRNFEDPKGTHHWVASRGFEILKTEQPKAFEWFQKQGVDISTIVKYTDRPDVFGEPGFVNPELFNLRGGHFYVVDDKNASISDTAVGQFSGYYNAAVNQFRGGEKTRAYQSLGTALHFISDLGDPVHTGEKVSSIAYMNPASNTLHEQYEKDAEDYRNTAVATASRGGQYTWAVSNSLQNTAIQAAKDSAEYYPVIAEYAFKFGVVPDTYTEAITEPLKNTQLNVAQVLYRFYIDVTGIENKVYVTVSGKNTPVWSQPQSTGSSTQVGTLVAGTIVTIASTQRNAAGNLWGKVAGKDCYIFMDNLTTYKPPVLMPLASDKQLYITTQKNTVVYTQPSSYSAIARTIANESTAVVIMSTTTNAAGNLWGKIKDGEYIFMGSVRASLSTTNTTPNQTTTQSLSVTNTVEGSFRVAVPVNYRLDCYQSPTATTRSTYISAKSASYLISCTKRLTMSDGSTRYFFRSGDNKNLYFVYTSSMNVESSSTNTTPSSEFKVINTVDGSWTITIPANTKVDLFPTPTSTTRTTWYSPKPASYEVYANKCLTMYDGSTRYQIHAANSHAQGQMQDLYFVFANSMHVSDPSMKPPTPQGGTVTVRYDANGGSGAPSSHTATKDGNGVIDFKLSS
jgi:hypothetical protein